MFDVKDRGVQMKVLIGSVLVNPFDEGQLDQSVVEELKCSLEQTGLEQVTLSGRMSETQGGWECDDGKHRIAAIKTLDPEFMVEFQSAKVSDAEMFQRLIWKNFSRRKPVPEELRRIVLRAKKALTEHPELCRCTFTENGTLTRSNHIGSTSCIANLLKIRQQRVSELLREQVPKPTRAFVFTGSEGIKEESIQDFSFLPESPKGIKPDVSQSKMSGEKPMATTALRLEIEELSKQLDVSEPNPVKLTTVHSERKNLVPIQERNPIQRSMQRLHQIYKKQGMSNAEFVKAVESYLDSLER